ncbi:hypothetical protein [Noviherbaspirillum pedocola]|uniref:Uncharacterized protein n=1 Tax=Noviherbaspirillum pedocola TaxID=2801341 RepID=A0A934T379_9BURK|nr:hypothetical protein [Noviherbaspirillum pedocola]MBK4738644.1 hypothetical protein [Noviherbaspirillum pedocola]
MPNYQVVGTGRDTGRLRKRVYTCASETDARLQAEIDGTLVSSVYELAPEPPTPGQLDCARNLGIRIPDGVSGDELSDLISLETWKDKIASPELKSMADAFGVAHTRYTGKKLMFKQIFMCLSVAGRERNLAAWFAYRVYREMVGGAYGSKIAGPGDEAIQRVAAMLAGDTSVMQSIRRYRGDDLIWFGKCSSPSGAVHQGGSNRTTAYKRASELLRPTVAAEQRAETLERAHRERERPPPPPVKIAEEPWRSPPSPTAKGCLPVLLIGFSVIFMLAAVTSSLVTR